MKLRKLLMLIILGLPTLFAVAQDAGGSFEQFIAKANSYCPIVFRDGWTVESFTCENDTVTTKISITGEAANYLPMIAANAEKMKQLWLGQMSQYGKQWNNLVDIVVANDKTLAIVLEGQSKEMSVVFLFTPNELKTYKP